MNLKKEGVPDYLIAHRTHQSADQIRQMRWKNDVHPSFYCVDTCAGEFQSQTPYYYSTYWGERTQYKPSDKNQC